MRFGRDYDERLRRATEPTLEIFDWLERGVPPAFQPALRVIREHLLDPDHSVAALREKLGIRSNGFITRLGRALGIPPWRLSRDCRLAIAARLLRDTEIPVADVIMLVGYDSESPFYRVFREWSGKSPGEYRDAARGAADKPEEVFTWDLWHKLCEGRLSPEESAILITALEELRHTTSSASPSS